VPLTLAMIAFPTAMFVVIAIVAAQTIHFAARLRGHGSLPLQVRVTYLALLRMGLWPPLAFIHLLLLLGTWVVAVADYCFLARALSLLPWNRSSPFAARP